MIWYPGVDYNRWEGCERNDAYCVNRCVQGGSLVGDAVARGLTSLLESNAALDYERREQLSDLYRAHWNGLCRYVRGQFGAGPPEPEDVVQSTFARFAAADTACIENPQAFLYTTARHLVIDYRRRALRGRAYEQVLEASSPEASVYELSPENVLLQTERFRILAEALERMPLRRRRLVLLNRFEGLSYGEIGERFGMSAENVRKHIERTLAECLRALDSAQRPRLLWRRRT